MHVGELVGTPQPLPKSSGRPAVPVVTVLILLQVRCTNIMTEQYLFWRHVANGWLAGWLAAAFPRMQSHLIWPERNFTAYQYSKSWQVHGPSPALLLFRHLQLLGLLLVGGLLGNGA